MNGQKSDRESGSPTLSDSPSVTLPPAALPNHSDNLATLNAVNTDSGTVSGAVSGTGAGGASSKDPDTPVTKPERPRENGGQAGPEPTRYGDWEKNGRCTDF